MFTDRIARIQSGDVVELTTMLEDFAPLIHKQAYALSYEDAAPDLRAFFIGLLKGMNLQSIGSEDKFLLSYLKTSVHRHAIYLSKQQRKQTQALPFSALSKDDQPVYEPEDSATSYSIQEELDFIRQMLTAKEAKVIYQHFYGGQRLKDIAIAEGVSLPAISQLKTKALKKLKHALKEVN